MFIPGVQKKEAWRSQSKISKTNMIVGLMEEEWITEDDADEWSKGNQLPLPIKNALNLIPPGKNRAKMRVQLNSFVTCCRDDELVVLLVAAYGKTEDEMDEFFRTYGD